ncbi:polymorphic toxin-type HINT domain-containing protein [Calycomorphotria hydatis]|uniref:Intein C-terminal splicing domain-containing protein n=1 Tax=Calycomorphotria hydatis TaxID=2528027 RepID=A0A517T9Z3_9PLAN|nr:polymorphic toxin-type HINT domain-containing protein [Calycomorphotria hydatis]QDT65183.1 hypothetical protein V22_24300 [Calycomorphotria hydatis]
MGVEGESSTPGTDPPSFDAFSATETHSIISVIYSYDDVNSVDTTTVDVDETVTETDRFAYQYIISDNTGSNSNGSDAWFSGGSTSTETGRSDYDSTVITDLTSTGDDPSTGTITSDVSLRNNRSWQADQSFRTGDGGAASNPQSHQRGGAGISPGDYQSFSVDVKMGGQSGRSEHIIETVTLGIDTQTGEGTEDIVRDTKVGTHESSGTSFELDGNFDTGTSFQIDYAFISNNSWSRGTGTHLVEHTYTDVNGDVVTDVTTDEVTKNGANSGSSQITIDMYGEFDGNGEMSFSSTSTTRNGSKESTTEVSGVQTQRVWSEYLKSDSNYDISMSYTAPGLVYSNETYEVTFEAGGWSTYSLRQGSDAQGQFSYPVSGTQHGKGTYHVRSDYENWVTWDITNTNPSGPPPFLSHRTQTNAGGGAVGTDVPDVLNFNPASSLDPLSPVDSSAYSQQAQWTTDGYQVVQPVVSDQTAKEVWMKIYRQDGFIKYSLINVTYNDNNNDGTYSISTNGAQLQSGTLADEEFWYDNPLLRSLLVENQLTGGATLFESSLPNGALPALQQALGYDETTGVSNPPVAAGLINALSDANSQTSGVRDAAKANNAANQSPLEAPATVNSDKFDELAGVRPQVAEQTGLANRAAAIEARKARRNQGGFNWFSFPNLDYETIKNTVLDGLEIYGSYKKGFTQGFFQDGLWGTLQGIGTILKNAPKVLGGIGARAYSNTPPILLYNWAAYFANWEPHDPFGNVKYDRELGQTANQAISRITEIGQEFIGLSEDDRDHLIAGNYGEMSVQPSDELKDVMDAARTAMISAASSIASEHSNLDAAKIAEYIGRAHGVILYEVAEGLILNAASSGLKSSKVAKYTSRLLDLDFIKDMPQLRKALGNMLETLAKIVGTRMCFVAGTKVHTLEGLKNIEDIKQGDLVLTRPDSADESYTQPEYKPVLNTFITNPDELYHVTYRTDAGDEETLSGTAGHPFFVVGKGWTTADELSVGNTLSLPEGRTAEVTHIRTEQAAPGEHFTTYNFEVPETHTYFVGEAGVWVHNTGVACAKLARRFNKVLEQTEDPAQAWRAAQSLAEQYVARGLMSPAAARKHLRDGLVEIQKKVSKGDYSQEIKDATQALKPNFTSLNKTRLLPKRIRDKGRYGDFKGSKNRPDGKYTEAHHLNQNAVYGLKNEVSGKIPEIDGISILLEGSSKKIGTEHYKFHRSMERFWDQYRDTNIRPTNAEYTDAMRRALIAADLTPTQARRLADLAASERRAYGFADNAFVPKVPEPAGLPY